MGRFQVLALIIIAREVVDKREGPRLAIKLIGANQITKKCSLRVENGSLQCLYVPLVILENRGNLKYRGLLPCLATGFGQRDLNVCQIRRPQFLCPTCSDETFSTLVNPEAPLLGSDVESSLGPAEVEDSRKPSRSPYSYCCLWPW